MKTVKVIIPVLILAIALGAGQIGNVKAWAESFEPGGFYHHWGYFHGGCCGPIIDQGCCGPNIGGCCDQNQQGCCDNGYQAGISDAIYDYQNGGVYNPVGDCLPCHSQDYWNNFHQGYDHQWGSYQQQGSSQGTTININGNNNYVSTNQESNQQQNPLQQLAHVACGFLNCGGPGPQYQQQGYDPIRPLSRRILSIVY